MTRFCHRGCMGDELIEQNITKSFSHLGITGKHSPKRGGVDCQDDVKDVY